MFERFNSLITRFLFPFDVIVRQIATLTKAYRIMRFVDVFALSGHFGLYFQMLFFRILSSLRTLLIVQMMTELLLNLFVDEFLDFGCLSDH